MVNTNAVPEDVNGLWRLVKAPEFWIGDLVRMQRAYDGEAYETEDRDGFDRDMSDVLEYWYVEQITRNGWITLTQQRRPKFGTDLSGKARYGSLFEETGESVKVRKNDARPFLLAVHKGLATDELSLCRDRWERLGGTPRSADYRMPAKAA